MPDRIATTGSRRGAGGVLFWFGSLLATFDPYSRNPRPKLTFARCPFLALSCSHLSGAVPLSLSLLFHDSMSYRDPGIYRTCRRQRRLRTGFALAVSLARRLEMS